MKNILCICLILGILWGFSACGREPVPTEATVSTTQAPSEEPALTEPEEEATEDATAQIEAQKVAILSFFWEHTDELEEIALGFCEAQKNRISLRYQCEKKTLGKSTIWDDGTVSDEYWLVTGTELNQLLDQCDLHEVFWSISTPPFVRNFQYGCCFSNLIVDQLGHWTCSLELIYSEETPDRFEGSYYHIEEIAPNWYLIEYN